MKKLEKNIFKISLPIFIELLCFMLLGTIDTLMLNMYDDMAVSAVVNANSIFNLFSVLLTVVATGVVVVLTRSLGAKDKEAEINTVGTGLIFNIILGASIMIILLCTGSLLLQVMNTDIEVFNNSASYLRIITFGLVSLAISQACGAIFRSYGKPLIVMCIVMISNLLNVGINYCLIFGNFGFPELGVSGAAMGTCISNVFSSVCAIICLMVILGYTPNKIKFSKIQLIEIFKIGIPSAFENFLYNFSQFLIMISVNLVIIGGVIGLAAATRAYVMTILNFVMLFSLSLANGNQIIIGYFIGEKDYEQAKKFTFKSFKYAIIAVLVVVIVVNIFWKQLIGLLSDDPLVFESLRFVFIVAVFLELGRSCNLMFIAALRAVGDTIFPVIMGVISMFGVAVLFSFLFGVVFQMGVLGVFIAQAMDETFRGLFMLHRFRTKDYELF